MSASHDLPRSTNESVVPLVDGKPGHAWSIDGTRASEFGERPEDVGRLRRVGARHTEKPFEDAVEVGGWESRLSGRVVHKMVDRRALSGVGGGGDRSRSELVVVGLMKPVKKTKSRVRLRERGESSLIYALIEKGRADSTYEGE